MRWEGAPLQLLLLLLLLVGIHHSGTSGSPDSSSDPASPPTQQLDAPPSPPVPLADLPPIFLTVGGDAGTEVNINQRPTTIRLELTGDIFAADVATEGPASSAVLSAFRSIHEHEPAGWAAIVAPALNSSSLLQRSSDRLVTIQLPRLRCYDLLRPEIVTVRLPGAAIASGRTVIAPSLRIAADPQVRPPQWGSVRLPPRELWRNCTHVHLAWTAPYHGGGVALAGYRLEVRKADGHDDDGGWNVSTSLIVPETNASDASGTIGPLEFDVAYQVRVRAYANGTGCELLSGDDGEPLLLHGGWRADSLSVTVGPGGGPIMGGTRVSVQGACLDKVRACHWGPVTAAGSLNGSAASEQNRSTVATYLNSSLLECVSAGALQRGFVELSLSGLGGERSARATDLSFEYYELQMLGVEPPAGPVDGGTNVRVAIELFSSHGMEQHVSLRDARCAFDGAARGTVAPIHASSAEIICPTPVADRVGPVNLSVSLDGGGQYTPPLPQATTFLYYNTSLSHVEPIGGPVRGGTLATVSGLGLAGGSSRLNGAISSSDDWCTGAAHCSAQIRCRFGVLGGRTITASVNDTHVICRSPPTYRVAEGGPPRLAAATDVLHPDRVAGHEWDDLGYATDVLSYSLNGEDYLRPPLPWTYYSPPTISSIAPADGPASGGYVITVRGDGFLNLPSGGAATALCRFGRLTTRVRSIVNRSMLTCDAPIDLVARDESLASRPPGKQAGLPAEGVGEDANFSVAYEGQHCCLVGQGAARVASRTDISTLTACEESCVAEPSCRFASYAASLGRCDLCSSCDVSAPDSMAHGVEPSLFTSYRRIEPVLPALLSFSLSLNGQQYELSDSDHRFELGYLMYAAATSSVSVSSGPQSGGTLITITGRGFARAAARPASTQARFGTLWWERNASLAPRCRFGDAGSTTPIELKDDRIVCPTIALGEGNAGLQLPHGGRVTLRLTVALNAVRFNGGGAPFSGEPVPAPAGATFDGAHFEPLPEINMTLYDQRVSYLHPTGGPTSGGTRVTAYGVGLHSNAPHAAACSFGDVAADARFLSTQAGVSNASVETWPIECTSPAHTAVAALPFRLALNYEQQPCLPSINLLPPAFGPASGAFDRTECGDGYRGSFIPRSGLEYDYYEPPIISHIFPTRGVHTGGTMLTIYGHGFRSVRTPHVTEQPIPILCGFGLSGSMPLASPNDTSVATLVSAEVLRCASPHRAAHGGQDAVAIALNAQDFEGGGARTVYTYLEAVQPTGSFPLSGPTSGGHEVRILGSGLVNASGNVSDAVDDSPLRCRFGDVEVAAILEPLTRESVEGALPRGSYDAAVAAGQTNVLRCIAPRAHIAGVTEVLRRNFDEAAVAARAAVDAENWTLGDAAHYEHLGGSDAFLGDAVIEGRTLRLTRGLLGVQSSSGSIVVSRRHVAPAAIVRSFEASFEILMEGLGGGRGLSFCYGPPPADEYNSSFGEVGTGLGLNIRLLTESRHPPSQVLEVSYDGEVFERMQLGMALRTNTWANISIIYRLESGLQVVHNGRHRVNSLPLYGYAPTASWQFAIGARAGPHGDTHRIDSLRIRSGELLAGDSVPLSVSVNGRDFTSVPGASHYFTPPIVSAILPSLGPESGDTAVLVTGFGFERATQLECRFDDVVVHATATNSSAVRCVSPPMLAHPTGNAQLVVSLNGVWSPVESTASVAWRVAAPPIVSDVIPSSGPLIGGTAIALQGSSFSVGVDYRCRFGGDPTRTVPATFDSIATRLYCYAPPVPANVSENVVSVIEVTTNGQQYTSSGLTFSQYRSFALLDAEPARGASLGGSLVRIDFQSFGQSLPFEAIRCKFGSAPPTEPLQHTDQWALCLAPPSYEARAVSFDHLLHFTDSNATDGTVKLDVAGDAVIKGGVLKLTDHEQLGDSYLSPREQIVGGASSIGSAILTLRRPYNALHWFELSFALLIGGNSVMGGFGISVCLGNLDASQPFGEDGAGDGLRLLFKTRRMGGPPYEAIEVWYEGEPHLVVPLGRWLRTSSWVQVVIRYDAEGLFVSHNDKVWIRDYKIRGWSPLHSWRLGVGARGAPTSYDPRVTAPFVEPAERHWVDNLRLSSGLLVAEALAPVSLSFNGQQFAPSPLEFEYYAMPSVSSITPTTGPLDGNTIVTVTGSKLDAGSELTNSGQLGYRCRFGNSPQLAPLPGQTCAPFTASFAHADADCYYGFQAVPATYGGEFAQRTYGSITSEGTMQCLTPSRADPRTLSIELALNAQQYTHDSTPFGFYTEAVLHELLPLSGPHHGGTAMLIHAAHLGNGSDSRCRFFGDSADDGGEASASFDVASGLVRCISPPLPSSVHGHFATYPSAYNATLHVTKNGQNYDVDGLPFAYFREPIPMVFDPPGGDIEGNTSVSIFGNFSGGFTQDYVCRFGELLAPATLVYSPTEHLLCFSPNAVNSTTQSSNITGARPVPLHVSLNGQQYHMIGTYMYYEEPLFAFLTPPSGPDRGGTQVSIGGVGMGANVQPGLDGVHQYYCRFGQHGKVTGSYNAADRVLRCDSPPRRTPDHDPPTFLVSVTINDQDYDPVSEFQYYREPVISAVLPPTGPVLGGSLVLVLGSSTFELSDREAKFATYVCQVGDIRVGANRSFANPDELSCTLPRFGAASAARLGFSGVEGLYELPFTVSLNGQQFTPRILPNSALGLDAVVHAGNLSNESATTSTAANFTYIGIVPQIGSIGAGTGHVGPPYNLPTSGPVDGNTTIVILGDPRELTGGSLYQCRIGPYVLNGTFIPSVAGVRCLTSPMAPGEYAVEVSLNGQQFTNVSTDGTAGLRRLVVHPPGTLLDVFPRSGPATKSFALSLNGSSLSGGTDYVCRFAHLDGLLGHNLSAEDKEWGWMEDSPIPPECCSQLAPSHAQCIGGAHPCTAASFVSDTEVRCTTPTVSTPRVVSVRVSVNGQQYATGMARLLLYPPPIVHHQTPTRGAASGGTSVLVHGSGFQPRTVNGTTHGMVSSSTRLPSIRCAFGPRKVPATALSPSVVRCFAPPGHTAGALNEIAIDASGVVASGLLSLGSRGPPTWEAIRKHSAEYETKPIASSDVGELFGDASPLLLHGTAMIEGGALKLTRSLASGGNTHEVGFVTFQRNAFFASPQYAVVFDFALRMGGFPHDQGGEGISISYGDLPQPLLLVGERGAGIGLRILFRTYVHNQIIVMWGGEIVHTVGVESLRTPGPAEFADVHIRLFGSPPVLELWFRGDALISGLDCPWFEPLEEWEWVVGARAGQRADDHWIANLTMRSSHSRYDVGAVELRVSLNDQDYDDGDAPFHVYYGDPVLTPSSDICQLPSTSTCARAFSPTSGPADGGTMVSLVGAQLGHGMPYTCRFGNAPYPLDPFPSDPAGHFARLDAMVAGCSEDPLNTRLPASARGSVCSPPPTSSVAFAHDPYADRDAAHVGSYEETKAVVHASYVPDGMGGFVRCVAPAASELPVSASTISIVALELALNAQDYSTNQENFTFYPAPSLHELSPSSGPLLGGTRVLVVGANLTGGSDYQCAFGNASDPVAAEPVNLTSTTMVCIAPTHEGLDAQMVKLSVTLNGQQYTDTFVPFTLYSTVNVQGLSPTSGPTDGETAVILHGGPFANGSDYRCRVAPSGPSRDGVPDGASNDTYWQEEAVTATVMGTPLNTSAILCHTPSQPRPLVATVEVTLNGQQYTSSALRTFEYTAIPLRVSSVSPSSGPLHGGTVLVVQGSGIRLGSDYCCDLGSGVRLPATFSPSGSFKRQVWDGTPSVPATPTNSAVDAIRCTTAGAAGVAALSAANSTLLQANESQTTLDDIVGVQLNVTISSNCQQYSPPTVAATFTFYDSPPPPNDLVLMSSAAPFITRAASISPTSGPVLGSANITILGGPFSDGSDYRCRFGPQMLFVPATPGSDGAALHCQSPVVHLDATASTATGLLEVTLNGQQFSNDQIAFETYHHPYISSLSPVSGPTVGGTSLSVHGHALTRGTHRLCRFVVGTPSDPTSHTVGATVDATVGHDGVLLCLTPPSISAITQPAVVEISLNGQQYTSNSARFDLFVAPSVSAVYPLQGPAAGGTQLLITGERLYDFGKISSFPGAVEDLRCRIGHVLVPTTFISETFVKCTSPPLIRLGGSGEMSFSFNAQPHGSVLVGSASVTDGVLKLTNPERYQVGTFIVRPHMHVPPPTAFDASFEVLIADGGVDVHDRARVSMHVRGFEPLSGMGVAFCFAPMDDEALSGVPFGEMGPQPARGLRVSLLTYTSRALEVAYDGVVLQRVLMGSDLRILSWTHMRIVYTPHQPKKDGIDGAKVAEGSGGLSVWYDDVLRVDNLSIPAWAAAEGWAWSLSASTSDATDAHWVDNLVITGANLSLAAAYPIDLTLNRQEYYATNTTFQYAAPPILSQILPTSGPRAGATSVTLQGVNLHAGTHYKCRFGGVAPSPAEGGLVLSGPVPGSLPLEDYMTPATYAGTVGHIGPVRFGEVLGGGTVVCASPNISAHADALVAVELSLNGQEYTQQGLTFQRYAPVLSGVYPTTGPTAGGFAIELSGSDLSNGTQYMCRFQRSAAADSAAELGSNTATSASPHGTNLSAAHDGSAHDAMVTLAYLRRDATTSGRASAHDAIVCPVPPMSALVHKDGPSMVNVAVSLNGQQYTSSAMADLRWPSSTARLELYSPPMVLSLSPSSGPSEGGTSVSVSGVNLTGGGNYTCRLQLFSTSWTFAGSLAGDTVVCVSRWTELRRCHSKSSICDELAEVPTALNISPNGQDYAPHGPQAQSFTLYRHPKPYSMSPVTGPSAGGTMLTIDAKHPLSGGTDYRCRFVSLNSNVSSTNETVNFTVSASFDEESGSVRCVSPSLAIENATVSAAVSISLNGQQFHSIRPGDDDDVASSDSEDAGSPASVAPLHFGFIGSPTITAISPTCGPTGGGTRVSISGMQLAGGLHYQCWFGAAAEDVNATTAAYFASDTDGAWCFTPPLRKEPISAWNLRLSLNGQQATGPGVSFALYAPLSVSFISPASGPSAGNTQVRVAASESLFGGCDVRCRYAGIESYEGIVTAAGSMDCLTPASINSGALEVSLNGQQYTSNAKVFEVYAPLQLLHAAPPLGPSAGGTVLRLITTNMSAGNNILTDVRCRVGEPGSSVDIPASVEQANEEGGARAVRCVSPPRPAQHSDSIRITLNGQQFSAPVGYMVLPPTLVHSVHPISVPDRGGTLVTVYGQGWAVEPQASQLLACRFGSVSVPATPLNSNSLTCLTPPSTLLGLASHLDLSFSHVPLLRANQLATIDPEYIPWSQPISYDYPESVDAWLGVNASLFGDAIVSDGALKLTTLLEGQSGGFIFSPQLEPGASLTSFELSLELSIGTGFEYEPPVAERPGGEGVSISVGELPDGAAGEHGSGDGLRVSLLTRRSGLSVAFGSRVLLSTDLPDPTRLRSNVSFSVIVALRHARLSLAIDGSKVLSDELLPEWSSFVLPSWRFGLGARTNVNAGENHFVHRLQLRVGTMLDAASAAVQVTTNGQQYTTDNVALTYFGDPIVSSVRPQLGPSLGGTAIIVNGAALHGGTEYRCRFGALAVSGEYDELLKGVRCRTPPLADIWAAVLPATNSSGELPLPDPSGAYANVSLAVTLNSYEYEASTLSFAYYAHPEVARVSPPGGPLGGDTLVTLVVVANTTARTATESGRVPWVGGSLPPGAQPECRFGNSYAVPATVMPPISIADLSSVLLLSLRVNPSAEFAEDVNSIPPDWGLEANASIRVLRCHSPPTVLAAARLPLHVSLNSQNYLDEGSGNFTFYVPAMASELLPNGGPHHGGTVVRALDTSMSADGLETRLSLCRFGMVEVAATLGIGGALRCAAPAAANASASIDHELIGSLAIDDSAFTVKAGGAARLVYGVLVLAEGSGAARGHQLAGQLIVTPLVSSSQIALRFFDVTLRAFSSGSGGMSLSVGDVPDFLGRIGGGLGLRVMFGAKLNSVNITYAGEKLHASTLADVLSTFHASVAVRPLGEARTESVGMGLADGVGWRTVRVAYLEDGLHVWIDTVPLVSSLRVTRWQPAVGWRLVLAASTGYGYGTHWLRSVHLRTDAAVHWGALPVALSLNGQQFGPASSEFYLYRHPTIVTFAPASGPVQGGTRVLVSGRAFAAGAAKHRCRFGTMGVVNATYHAQTGFLSCVSPPVTDAPLSTDIDAQNVTANGTSLLVGTSIVLERDGQLMESSFVDGSAFAYHSVDSIDASRATVQPSSGPVQGGTLLTLAHDAIAGAAAMGATTALRCRFDLRGLAVLPRVLLLAEIAQNATLASIIGFNASHVDVPAETVPASLSAGGTAITCITPRVNLTHSQMHVGAGAALPFALSLNAQQFTPFTELHVYEPPRIDFVSPACGPLSGGTHVTVVGERLRGGTANRCRLDELVVNATYVSTLQGDLMTCKLPSAPFGAAFGGVLASESLIRSSAQFAVSLNAQQYVPIPQDRKAPGTAPDFDVHAGFGLYKDPPRSTLVIPVTVDGAGQLVTVFGSQYHGGCSYACRFGGPTNASTSIGTFIARDGGVRCIAPAMPSGTVASVWISLNGQQFVESGANLTWAIE